MVIRVLFQRFTLYCTIPSVIIIAITTFIATWTLQPPHLCAQGQTQSIGETLLSHHNQADYLIITPSQFAPALEEHAQWRSQTTRTHTALRTRIITLEDIYETFGDSVKHLPQARAEAIRHCISYALQFWKLPPSRVLLVGSTNLLPAYRIRVAIPLLLAPQFLSREDSIPMDEWYVVNKYRESFNTRPQAAIGRIPGRTSEEILRVLRKVRLFEESGNTLGFDLSTRATVILDAEDSDIFENQFLLLSDFLRYTLRYPLPSDVLHYYKIMHQPNARRQVTQAMSNNRPIVMYYGHGAPDEWSKFSILRTDDVGNSIARNGKPFMMITIGCSQNYDIPRVPSIVEALMLLDNGGAVMTLASSGFSSYPENNWFIRLFYQELFTNRTDIGTAMLNAKNRSYEGGLPTQDNFFRRVALLGDPAMVPFSRLATSVSQHTSLPTTQQQISIAPNPAQYQTHLHYTIPHTGIVRIELINSVGQQVAVWNELQHAGPQTFVLLTDTLPNGTYYCRISIGTYVQTGLLTIYR
ncbi:MAG: C25 family cysteine peptidase [Bacteroidota bacterium]|nr:C25 family cysteine peptidase [Candidatus Kapabacteria bacterium]MDW8221162.1 C25 family cysteine peptidase [Bacteroidota bacterium]